MKLTENFNKAEFDCRDKSEMPDSVFKRILRLSNALQEVRWYIGLPIKITSAYRSLKYNNSIGSKDTSQHVKGNAADIQVKGMSPFEVYNIIEILIEDGIVPEGGLGLYDTFVHYDVRGYKARWNNETKT